MLITVESLFCSFYDAETFVACLFLCFPMSLDVRFSAPLCPLAINKLVELDWNDCVCWAAMGGWMGGWICQVRLRPHCDLDQ